MSETIGVVVATYGDLDVWEPFAQRAMNSVLRQTRSPDALMRVHGTSLHQARNDGASGANTDWLVFLDADDELDDRYLEFMAAGTGDVRQPATLGVLDGREDDYPVVIPARSLIDSNYIVIGAMCRSEQFLRLGGFGDWQAFEDWDLWLRCWLDGAVVQPVPEAIYRVHVRPDSRNQLSHEAVRTYNAIRKRHLPAARAKRLA